MLDDGEAAFLFLLEEPHSERSCEMSFFFFSFFFFFFFLPEGKVIEMSEKEPGSLEEQGVIKVSERLQHFKYSSAF